MNTTAILLVIFAIAVWGALCFLLQKAETCILYEKWKSCYIPTLEEFQEVTNRMKILYNLPKPNGAQLAEFCKLKLRANELSDSLNRLQTLNPRRKHKK